ncbi:MAG: HU family DNA-binding protein [Armatimonadetes bacterium]|nr:HU family DNA-binding protein [Armatimonadota bacterium]
MTKAEFTEKIASRLSLRRREAAGVLEAVLAEISEALQRGEKVQLIPFGSFEVRERKGREGRNPRTGEKIDIKGRRVAVFQAGKGLRDVVE